MLQALIENVSITVSKKYKISKKEVADMLTEKLKEKKELSEKWVKAKNIKDIYRTAEFKNFFKNFKKELYYSLRTYQKTSVNAEADITHVSTKERQPHKDLFFIQIQDLFLRSTSIIDVGGGLFPLTIPLSWFGHIQNYVWLDKDKKSMEKLSRYRNDNKLSQLKLFNDSIGANNWQHYLPVNTEEFDLAIMLKIIPVINRQEKGLLSLLAQIPSKQILVTGSKESMVKRVDITKRERLVLRKFIAMTGKEVTQEIDIANEFGYIIS